EFRRRRRLTFALGGIEAFAFLALFLAGRLARSRRVVYRPAGEEHHLRQLFLALGRLEADLAELALPEKAAVVEGAAEEGLHAEKVVLLPVVHLGMIVALRTADVDAEEDDAHLAGEPVEVHDARAEELGGILLRGVLLVGQHQLAEDAVPGT